MKCIIYFVVLFCTTFCCQVTHFSLLTVSESSVCVPNYLWGVTQPSAYCTDSYWLHFISHKSDAAFSPSLKIMACGSLTL